MKNPLFALISISAVSTVSGAVVIDGTRDASYGSPLAVQQVFTGFGDNTDASSSFANGSELDAAYAEISDGRLNLFFAGNVQTNFNKLNIFIDSGAGGMNRLTPLATD
jgi:hypothetical protein